ncbi:MAG: hypothetical protein NTW55_06805 [Planctomycetota bacterium]|nr:hypothetical protein [Planctomycetota bacterium]
MSKQSAQTVKSAEPATNKQDSIAGLLARIFWMLIGNMVLVISMIITLQHKGSMFHAADLVFWITIAALILVRYLDIKFWGGMTAAGGPATIANWNRYAVALLTGSTAVWIIFHAINYMMVATL